MHDSKPTKKQVEALAQQIKHDQKKPVRENERRVRVGSNFNDSIKKMTNTPPINNKDLVKWTRKQKKDIK